MSFNVPLASTQMDLFTNVTTVTTTNSLLDPASYTGLAGFHKYWGKKPIESLAYLIDSLTKEGDVVLDPFLGSGLISIECLSRNRRFIGIDINPFAIEHTTFLLNLPTPKEYYEALIKVELEVSNKINATYRTSDGRVASHYLWEDNKIASVWIKPESGRTRIEMDATQDDYDIANEIKEYEPRYFRKPKFFTNSRINVKPSMSLRDVFTNRAMRNIDLIISSTNSYPLNIKRALLLTLTSSSGQMSNMVFAIKNRGGKQNTPPDSSRIEVGSWVIGFWIPKTHFEINVWNCFENRANKLLKALPESSRSYNIIREVNHDFITLNYDSLLLNNDCRKAMRQLPDESISFVCTDPPHSDRVPYLELSELWNSILGYNVDFENEIVVSNAKERNKSKVKYNSDMTEFFLETNRILKIGGYIALFFNARDEESWENLKCIETVSQSLIFRGCFPMVYSATSVVQDNRSGSMKSDYVLIFQKGRSLSIRPLPHEITCIPGWSISFPEKVQASQ